MDRVRLLRRGRPRRRRRADGPPTAGRTRRSRQRLAALGAKVSDDRVTFDGNVVTAAGVSAGIDLGIALSARLSDELTARAIQLGMEYAPEPPFDVRWSVAERDPALLERLEVVRAAWFDAVDIFTTKT